MDSEKQSHPRVLAYQRMIRAFNSNDLSQVSEFVSEDLRYTIPGKSRISGTTRGISAHLAVLALARELTGGTLRLTPSAVAVDGDYLFIGGRITGQRAGMVLDCDHFVVYRFEADVVVEGRTLPVDLYTFDTFWR